MPDEIRKKAEIEHEGTPASIMTEVVRQVLSQGASVAGIATLQSMFDDGKLTPELVLHLIHTRGAVMKISVSMEIPQTTDPTGVIHPAVPLGGGEEVITLQPGLFDVPEIAGPGDGIH